MPSRQPQTHINAKTRQLVEQVLMQARAGVPWSRDGWLNALHIRNIIENRGGPQLTAHHIRMALTDLPVQRKELLGMTHYRLLAAPHEMTLAEQAAQAAYAACEQGGGAASIADAVLAVVSQRLEGLRADIASLPTETTDRDVESLAAGQLAAQADDLIGELLSELSPGQEQRAA